MLTILCEPTGRAVPLVRLAAQQPRQADRAVHRQHHGPARKADESAGVQQDRFEQDSVPPVQLPTGSLFN